MIKVKLIVLTTLLLAFAVVIPLQSKALAAPSRPLTDKIFAASDTGTCDGSQYTSSTPLSNNVIYCGYIDPAIEFLSAGVGVVVVIMLIIGGIQYISSNGNPQAVSAAKKKIINALLALLIFGLLFAFLNFIIPGGIIQP